MKKFGIIILAAMLGSAFTLALSRLVNSENPSVKIEHIEGGVPIVKAGYKSAAAYPDFTVVSEKALPAVVHIRAEISGVSNENPHMELRGFPFFFEDQTPRRRQGIASGSGVIINGDGYIVTNNHVVDNADEVEVILWDNRKLTGEVIGKDPDTDLAVVKVKEKGLPYLAFANSDLTKIGEWALAVGNPFNLTSTVTAGIISAKARDINIINARGGGDQNTGVESFIQTDAAINHGNSGGALVNMEGGLIGINTAIASPTGAYSGYGFAIPSNLVSKVAEDIISFGAVQRGWLGLQISDLHPELIKEKNLSIEEGVYVHSMPDNSAAKEAGVKEDDIIIKMDDRPAKTKSALIAYVASKRPGDKVKLVVNRKGKEIVCDVTLKNKDGNTGKVVITKDDRKVESLGVEWEDLSKADLKKLELKQGVRVKSTGNGKLGKYTDMRDGFIVTDIDNQPVASAKEANEILRKKKSGDQIILGGRYPNSQREYLFALRM